MKIFMPYTHVQPITRMLMRGYEYTGVRMSGPGDYSRFLEARWSAGEDFINIEHDAIPWQGSVESLRDCPELWCVFPGLYDDASSVRFPTLNMARFRAEVLRGYPVDWPLQREGKDRWAIEQGRPSWQYCDSWIKESLEAGGLAAHFHGPPVANGNPDAIAIYERPFFEFPIEGTDSYVHMRES